jgi:hypothetical protein
MPFLKAFFEQYPTPHVLNDADPEAIKEKYFRTLGLFRRAWWLITRVILGSGVRVRRVARVVATAS